MDEAQSLRQARAYLLDLPRQLERRLGDAALLELNELLARFEEFFNIAASIDHRATVSAGDRDQATEVCNFGFLLLDKLLEMATRLDLPDEHRQIEQLSLAIVHWAIRHGATLNDPQPVVNAIARLAGPMRARDALLAVSDLLADIVEHCAPELLQGREGGDDPGSWRDLHACRCEIAIRSGDPGAIRRAFDEFLLYLPQQAQEFLVDCMKKAMDGDYPPLAGKMVADYLGRASVTVN
jgi:hypothetical protein